MPEQYVPGKCNIGSRGRTMRLSIGLLLVAFSVFAAVLLVVFAQARLLRLILFVPSYAGLLSILEGTMSFCVFHAARGTYDFSEPVGSSWRRSETRRLVESENGNKRTGRKQG